MSVLFAVTVWASVSDLHHSASAVVPLPENRTQYTIDPQFPVLFGNSTLFGLYTEPLLEEEKETGTLE